MITFLSVIFCILFLVSLALWLLGIISTEWNLMLVAIGIGAVAAVIAAVCYILQGGI